MAKTLREQPVRGSDLVTSFDRFWSAVWAITLREFRNKYGNRRLGIFWSFIEPTVYVAVMSVVMTLANSHTSPLGGHVVPFVAMGVMCYMFFNAVEHSVRAALRGNKQLLTFPRVKPFDIYFARMLTELGTLTVVFTAMFAGFVFGGLVRPPAEPERLLPPLLCAAALGFGMGLLNSSVSTLFKPWENIYAFVARFFFFTSGIFFIADSWPTNVQALLYYLPLLHNSEWFRSAWYGHFESRFLDVQYVVSFVGVALLFGLLVERTSRKAILGKL